MRRVHTTALPSHSHASSSSNGGAGVVCGQSALRLLLCLVALALSLMAVGYWAVSASLELRAARLETSSLHAQLVEARLKLDDASHLISGKYVEVHKLQTQLFDASVECNARLSAVKETTQARYAVFRQRLLDARCRSVLARMLGAADDAAHGLPPPPLARARLGGAEIHSAGEHALIARFHGYLTELQTQRECGSAPLLLVYGNNFGFGSDLATLTFNFRIAVLTQRTLVLSLPQWRYANVAYCPQHDYECFFEPLSACNERHVRLFEGAEWSPYNEYYYAADNDDNSDDGGVVADSAAVTRVVVSSWETWVAETIRQVHEPLEMHTLFPAPFGNLPSRWYCAAFYSYILRLNDVTRGFVDARIATMQLPRDMIVLHVRRGDAVDDGRQYIPLSVYMDVVAEWRADEAARDDGGGGQLAAVTSVYVMTDDVDVLQEASLYNANAGGKWRFYSQYDVLARDERDGLAGMMRQRAAAAAAAAPRQAVGDDSTLTTAAQLFDDSLGSARETLARSEAALDEFLASGTYEMLTLLTDIEVAVRHGVAFVGSMQSNLSRTVFYLKMAAQDGGFAYATSVDGWGATAEC